MKAILDTIKQFFSEALKHLDWKKLLYDGMKANILPAFKKAAADTTTKIDDVMVQGLEHFVEAYLKPPAPPAPTPPAPSP